ncbi:MAG: phosphoribosyltransferase [Thermodesulfovibrionales bacterium]
MKLVEDRSFRNKLHIYQDRTEAGKILASKLQDYKDSDAIVLAIPSGGVPVGAEIARALNLFLDLLIVRKIQIPYNPEAGFGAVGPDGEPIFNESVLSGLMLAERDILEQVTKARESVKKRNELFRKNKPLPLLKDRVVIIVDDGLASGYTMLAGINYVKKSMPAKVIVAVPTASERAIKFILPQVNELICPNVRGGPFLLLLMPIESGMTFQRKRC